MTGRIKLYPHNNYVIQITMWDTEVLCNSSKWEKCQWLFQLESQHSSPTKLEGQMFRYARDNLAKVSIYIKDPYVSKYITEEKITEIAFVGTVGGILGLFMGFSFISAVEICYICLFFKCFKNYYFVKK